MTDSLTESDVRRIDKHVDPTAVNADDIESSLNDDFEGGAREAFAEALEAQRAPVRDEARDLLGKRLTTNPADGSTQLRNSKGHFASNVSEVTSPPQVDDSTGSVTVETDAGTVELGSVDLNAGADGTRDARYSR